MLIDMATTRAIAWVKNEPVGIEFAEVLLGRDRLSATGVAIGSEPEPYRLDYTLETGDGFVTSRMNVTSRGQGWTRSLDLRRSTSGTWTATGDADIELPALADALDCDLGLSPLTNSMPVLRHRLFAGGGPLDFVMAWISVPDLTIHASGQRYTLIRTQGVHPVIRYESTDSDFSADLTFDEDGLVFDYPGIGRRL
jgi:uncharacterized protein